MEEGYQLQEVVHRRGPSSQSGSQRQQQQEQLTNDEEGDPISGVIAWWCMLVLSVLTFPLSLLFLMEIMFAKDYERVVLFRLGHLLKGEPKGPGIVVVFSCIERKVVIDLRSVVVDVRPQSLLTKDHVSINVDGVVYYHVVNPRKASFMGNIPYSTGLRAQTTLRDILGTRNLSEIIGKRQILSRNATRILAKRVKHWGVDIDRLEIKGIGIPADMQRSMAAEAEAERRARAKVILAEAEGRASKALKEASDIISQSGVAIQLRSLQTMSAISREKDTTILFPMPMPILPPVTNICVE